MHAQVARLTAHHGSQTHKNDNTQTTDDAKVNILDGRYLYTTRTKFLVFPPQINRVEPAGRSDGDKRAHCEELIRTLASVTTERVIKGVNVTPKTPREEDLLAKAIIDPPGGCMVFDRRKINGRKGLWISAKLSRRDPKRKREGYLEIIIGKDNKGRPIIMAAHRLLCWAANGPQGKNTCMHLCFFSRCTNCNHLYRGSGKQNHKIRAKEIANNASINNLKRKRLNM